MVFQLALGSILSKGKLTFLKVFWLVILIISRKNGGRQDQVKNYGPYQILALVRPHTFLGVFRLKNPKKHIFQYFLETDEKNDKKFFFDFFHDFDLKVSFFLEKKKHFGQKLRKTAIFQTSWAHSYVGMHPMTIIFSFTCSPTSVLQPEQIS